MKTKLRPVGKITSELEPLLFELALDHDLQHGEILALIHAWLMIHVHSQEETYTEDGTKPIYYYGPRK